VIDVDYLAAVLTPNSVESAWVTEEFTLARQRELEERRVIILPLLFAPVELPLNLRARKQADFRDFDRGFVELMRVLDREVVTRSSTPPYVAT
jgi:TIR domain